MKRVLLFLLSAVPAVAITVGSLYLPGSNNPDPAPTFQSFWIVGDSKSTYDYLQSQLVQEFDSRFTNHVLFSSSPPRDAVSGRSVGSYRLSVDASLLARTNYTPDYVLLNLGVNDVNGDSYDVGDGTTWKTNLAYILDSIHAQWTNVQIYQMRVWKANSFGSNYTAKLNLIDDTLIPQVHSNRAWCHLGPDERIFLQDSDGGLTMMVQPEGIHPNTAGQAATALNWKLTLFP